MRTKLLYIALLCSTFAYGWMAEYYPTTLGDGICQYQGPWGFEEVKCNQSGTNCTWESYNNLYRWAWGPYGGESDSSKVSYQFNDADGIGFKMHCRSSNTSDLYRVYSLYSHSENVPAYTRKRLTWHFLLKGYSNHHPQTVALYAHTSMSTMKTLNMDCTYDYSETGATGRPYMIDTTRITGESYGTERNHASALKMRTFDFDNRNGATMQSKTWVLLLTQCVCNTTSAYTNTDQWGSFKDYGYTWETFYYNYVTFDANGGEGEMANQTIENNGTLTANAFTRDNHTFAGWATEPNGEVVYADAAEITANEYSKGPVTLYAVWNRVNYGISYELNGGTASNPSSYTEATETFTLANPTRENSTFLGWVGSNGSTPEMTVTITQGSTGDKTFIAHWECETSTAVISLIDAIGEVTYSAESKTKIDAARAAYDALTAGEKADVPATKLETLRMAEATYAAEELSTIQFMNRDASQQIGDDQLKVIYYPAFPAGATKWQTERKNVSDDKTIVIQAE